MTTPFNKIFEINDGGRNLDNLSRRIMKANEEAGEINEAYLSVTSITNPKQKTWNDVREEAVDLILMSVDIAFTQLPTDNNVTYLELEKTILDLIDEKLSKWKLQIDAGNDITQNFK